MKIKTVELTGLALAYAVAIAKGIPAEAIVLPQYAGDGPWRRWKNEGKYDGYVTGPDMLFDRKWEAAGPIIEKEIDNIERRDGYFYAHRFKRHTARVDINFKSYPDEQEAFAYGPTVIIACMRCFVLAKLGAEVELPDNKFLK